MIALALLCVEGLAAEHGPLLVEAARVGDFDVVTDRRAALVAFGIETLGDVERAAPLLDVAVPDGDVMERTAWAATEALRILPGLVADPERHRALWAEEADAFDASARALVEGWATIEERPEHDLAIVRVDVTHPDAGSVLLERHAAAPRRGALGHGVLRVATIAGGRVEVRYRYESWVRLSSRRPRPRVDLAPVAAELTRAETTGGRWVFDGAGAITGALHLAEGRSSTLEPEHVVDMVCARLDTLDGGTAAWDPYAVPTPAG